MLGGTPACICNAHKLSLGSQDLIRNTGGVVLFSPVEECTRGGSACADAWKPKMRHILCATLSVAVSAKRKFLNGARWHVCAPANRTLTACLRSFMMKGYVE